MNIKKSVFHFVLFTAITLNGKAQETTRKIGLSAIFQGNQYGIAAPIWVGKKYVVEPNLSIRSAQSIGSVFGLGVVQRFYFNEKTLAPYAGVTVGSLISIPSINAIPKSEKQVDILAGVSIGAEYFLGPQFSFRVEAQANFTKSGENSNQFGNPGNVNFNTGTLLSASIYF